MPDVAFPWGEPAPDPGFQGSNGQEFRTCRYKMRLLCDPAVKPFVCAYRYGRPIWKDSWDATAQWLFTVQDGRVTAINRDETARDDQVQLMLACLKNLIPSLEGYACLCSRGSAVATGETITSEVRAAAPPLLPPPLPLAPPED